MRRTTFAFALLIATACGPDVASGDAGGTTSSTDATDDGTPSTSSSGIVDDSSSGATAADTSAGSSSEASSTGEPFTFSADETLVELECAELGPRLWIEIYPGVLDGQCLPSPKLDDLAMIGIEPWDGMAGTLKIQGDGPAIGGFGGDPDLGPALGFITIEVSAPWTVESATIELMTNDNSLSGTADLSECGPDDPHDPCE